MSAHGELATEPYALQAARWPQQGRHILAHWDDDTIVLYQAYNRTIGTYAAAHGRFGGAFSYSRMSWVKPNFLWMMYRSGWGTKQNQEVTLAIRVRRVFFEQLLAACVPSTFEPRQFASRAEWRAAVQRSDVRLQWDPDHNPDGTRTARKAIQLGIRGETLERYGKEEILSVLDLSELVESQRHLAVRGVPQALKTPVETVYRPMDEGLAEKLCLDAVAADA